MNTKIFILIIGLITTLSVSAQSAEENTRNGYVQNTDYSYGNDNDKSNKKLKEFTYKFKGKTFKRKEDQMWWSGSTAVMNSVDGSFQILFNERPKQSKTYGVADYPDDTHISISLIADNDQHYYFSDIGSGGSVKVTVKGTKVTFDVKNVDVCESRSSSNCGKVSGKFTLDLYGEYN